MHPTAWPQFLRKSQVAGNDINTNGNGPPNSASSSGTDQAGWQKERLEVPKRKTGPSMLELQGRKPRSSSVEVRSALFPEDNSEMNVRRKSATAQRRRRSGDLLSGIMEYDPNEVDLYEKAKTLQMNQNPGQKKPKKQAVVVQPEGETKYYFPDWFAGQSSSNSSGEEVVLAANRNTATPVGLNSPPLVVEPALAADRTPPPPLSPDNTNAFRSAKEIIREKENKMKSVLQQQKVLSAFQTSKSTALDKEKKQKEVAEKLAKKAAQSAVLSARKSFGGMAAAVAEQAKKRVQEAAQTSATGAVVGNRSTGTSNNIDNTFGQYASEAMVTAAVVPTARDEKNELKQRESQSFEEFAGRIRKNKGWNTVRKEVLPATSMLARLRNLKSDRKLTKLLSEERDLQDRDHGGDYESLPGQLYPSAGIGVAGVPVQPRLSAAENSAENSQFQTYGEPQAVRQSHNRIIRDASIREEENSSPTAETRTAARMSGSAVGQKTRLSNKLQPASARASLDYTGNIAVTDRQIRGASVRSSDFDFPVSPRSSNRATQVTDDPVFQVSFWEGIREKLRTGNLSKELKRTMTPPLSPDVATRASAAERAAGTSFRGEVVRNRGSGRSMNGASGPMPMAGQDESTSGKKARRSSRISRDGGASAAPHEREAQPSNKKISTTSCVSDTVSAALLPPKAKQAHGGKRGSRTARERPVKKDRRREDDVLENFDSASASSASSSSFAASGSSTTSIPVARPGDVAETTWRQKISNEITKDAKMLYEWTSKAMQNVTAKVAVIHEERRSKESTSAANELQVAVDRDDAVAEVEVENSVANNNAGTKAKNTAADHDVAPRSGAATSALQALMNKYLTTPAATVTEQKQNENTVVEEENKPRRSTAWTAAKAKAMGAVDTLPGLRDSASNLTSVEKLRGGPKRASAAQLPVERSSANSNGTAPGRSSSPSRTDVSPSKMRAMMLLSKIASSSRMDVEKNDNEVIVDNDAPQEEKRLTSSPGASGERVSRNERTSQEQVERLLPSNARTSQASEIVAGMNNEDDQDVDRVSEEPLDQQVNPLQALMQKYKVARAASAIPGSLPATTVPVSSSAQQETSPQDPDIDPSAAPFHSPKNSSYPADNEENLYDLEVGSLPSRRLGTSLVTSESVLVDIQPKDNEDFVLVKKRLAPDWVSSNGTTAAEVNRILDLADEKEEREAIEAAKELLLLKKNTTAYNILAAASAGAAENKSTTPKKKHRSREDFSPFKRTGVVAVVGDDERGEGTTEAAPEDQTDPEAEADENIVAAKTWQGKSYGKNVYPTNQPLVQPAGFEYNLTAARAKQKDFQRKVVYENLLSTTSSDDAAEGSASNSSSTSATDHDRQREKAGVSVARYYDNQSYPIIYNGDPKNSNNSTRGRGRSVESKRSRSPEQERAKEDYFLRKLKEVEDQYERTHSPFSRMVPGKSPKNLHRKLNADRRTHVENLLYPGFDVHGKKKKNNSADGAESPNIKSRFFESESGSLNLFGRTPGAWSYEEEGREAGVLQNAVDGITLTGKITDRKTTRRSLMKKKQDNRNSSLYDDGEIKAGRQSSATSVDTTVLQRQGTAQIAKSDSLNVIAGILGTENGNDEEEHDWEKHIPELENLVSSLSEDDPALQVVLSMLQNARAVVAEEEEVEEDMDDEG
ncbi:unnamed protein product [Amoebophrya sp. A120]|nr:unnamed protein product [Amoebophrya sp. A120]|eukprot:GSA120T00022114001.1